ncbi:S-methyl-5-thioribose-1-phosphate isomerase [bacterium]|nr:S-methyl-5-thioribose-1-phosphate isomerase [bacterium]
MRPIDWIGDGARLVDQRLLPHQEVWVTCRSLADFERAIRDMLIRGAPAIGICAAYGLASVALQGGDLEEACVRLAATRPTAVNLFWAIERMRKVWTNSPGQPERLVQEAVAIHDQDVAMCRSIGEHGADLFEGSVRLLTHCNAGALATGDYGTALGVVRSLAKRNQVQWVWVDETRPFLQGARLTAFELQREQIPCRLICDNMAGHFMQRKQVDAVIVGADRITRLGDVANKIGTSTLAVLCKEYGVPFYVAAPWSTLDLAMDSGWDIPIEERSSLEVSHHAGTAVAPEGVTVANPAFDVTFHPYITAIITERGVLRAPFADGIRIMDQRDEVALGQSGG